MSKLRFDKHIAETVTKASNKLAFVRSSIKMKATTYKPLVRLIMVYASTYRDSAKIQLL